MADARTPMAWQHRDMNYHHANQQQQRAEASPSRRYTPTPSSRYGGPPTPSSAHSRHSRTPDHRRDARGSSSERYIKLRNKNASLGNMLMKNCFTRYSHQSTRKLVRDSRSAQGSSRGSRGYRSQPSPSSTEETAEETTETDSQNERGPGPADYAQFHHQQQQPYM